MSDTDDKDSKTEAPSDKKVRDAIEKGNIPFSREAPMFASILGILLVLAFAARSTTKTLTEKLSLFVNRPQDFRLESGSDAAALIQAVALEVGQFLIPTIAILAGCSLAASILQNVPSIVTERIQTAMEQDFTRERLEAHLRPSGFGGIFKVVVQVRNNVPRQSSAPEVGAI